MLLTRLKHSLTPKNSQFIIDDIINRGEKITIKRGAQYPPVTVPQAVSNHARFRGNAFKQKGVSVFASNNAMACLDEEKGFFSHGKVVNGFSYKTAVDKLNSAKDYADYSKFKVLDLTSPGGKFYSHFLFDVLPKVQVIKSLGIDLNFFDKIIINFKDLPFIKEACELLKIDFNKVEGRNAQNRILKCNCFVSVSEPRDALYTSDWIVDFIRETFSSNLPISTSTSIYISRNLGSKRIITNENELLDELNLAGINTVYCEKNTVKQNAKVFRAASVVVAPHGAGLANIVFCRPGTTVVELFSSHWSDEFWKLCIACGLNYIPVQVERENGTMADLATLDYANSYLKLNAENMRVNSLLSLFNCSEN
ncbi:glycosyltransferase family 61 protein [Pseudoalteromonas tetraodonis]|uniref:glycosyltransferase family 61 protein n=1 Tax=Pseudoalteromonas tetraodonis TaxID=43659 RepID=UPI003A98152B